MNNIALSRRCFMGAAAFVTVAGRLLAAELTGPLTPEARRRLVFERRDASAQAELRSALPARATNGDEDAYVDRRASFSKTLPHNDLGEVDPGAYRQWLAILSSGDPAQFNSVPREPGAVERLNNPQAAYAIDLVGPDATALPLAAPPAFASPAMATEMTELYWLALLRDMPFRDYGADPLAHAAVADLKAAGFPQLSEGNLFRGETEGERRGLLISQFLWHDIPYGAQTIEQRLRLPAPGQSFLTRFEEWLACQRGAAAQAAIRSGGSPRYISSLGDLCEYVHRDFSFQAFLNAALIIQRLGGGHSDAVLSPTNPYRGSRTQFGDITFGNKNLLSLLAQASLLAQKTSYYQKWQVHRRARPETIGARIDVQLSGRKDYDLHQSLLQSDGLARVKAAYGSWLLPQAYPEGCPTHPSYPAAHAVNAGACATVLKAFFDESYVVPDPVEATADGARLDAWHGEPLTLGGEIDKLAANIALARDAAGVHFRSDSTEGLKLGEALAIGLLADTCRTYNERFEGFVLTRFDGHRIRISDKSVQQL